jgi:hypothetical protein
LDSSREPMIKKLRQEAKADSRT